MTTNVHSKIRIVISTSLFKNLWKVQLIICFFKASKELILFSRLFHREFERLKVLEKLGRQYFIVEKNLHIDKARKQNACSTTFLWSRHSE